MYRYIEVLNSMPQVSRNPVHKDVFYSIRDDFLWIISDLRTSEDVKSFFYDFFTKTERIMLAKRLAVAAMIHEGYNYQDIHNVLHVSTSTITRVSSVLDSGGTGIKRAIDRLVKEERLDVFWKKVNKAIDSIARLRK